MRHVREVRDRKSRENKEKRGNIVQKESTGANYWRDKFREMAEKNRNREIEVRGAAKHVERIGRGEHFTRKRKRSRSGGREKNRENSIDKSKESEKVSEKEREVSIEKSRPVPTTTNLDTENLRKGQAKVISPAILKISAIFEKSEVKVKEKTEEKVSKVRKIRDGLEALMGNHEVRKAKHEIKRRTKKPIEKVSRENPQRKVIDR